MQTQTSRAPARPHYQSLIPNHCPEAALPWVTPKRSGRVEYWDVRTTRATPENVREGQFMGHTFLDWAAGQDPFIACMVLERMMRSAPTGDRHGAVLNGLLAELVKAAVAGRGRVLQ